MDAAHDWTDKQLEALERKMAREYARAAREMRAKQEKYLASYGKALEQREKALDDTPEARKAHKEWLSQQAAQISRYDDMVADLSERAARANEEASNALSNTLPNIYAENANRTAYSLEKSLNVGGMFSLVNEDAARLLMKEDKSLFPVGHNYNKDIRWNKQKFRSAITQGILQGESIPNIVKRTNSIFGMNKAAAVRAARTATTNAENAGRLNSLERAVQRGIKVKQEWVATLDGRTRHSHRMVDGEVVAVGELFSNGCKFPGDPDGSPSEVYNCRCALAPVVEGVDTKNAARWSRLPEGMTYEDWKIGAEAATDRRQRGSLLNGNDIATLKAYTAGKYSAINNYTQYVHGTASEWTFREQEDFYRDRMLKDVSREEKEQAERIYYAVMSQNQPPKTIVRTEEIYDFMENRYGKAPEIGSVLEFGVRSASMDENFAEKVAAGTPGLELNVLGDTSEIQAFRIKGATRYLDIERFSEYAEQREALFAGKYKVVGTGVDTVNIDTGDVRFKKISLREWAAENSEQLEYFTSKKGAEMVRAGARVYPAGTEDERRIETDEKVPVFKQMGIRYIDLEEIPNE